MANNTVDFKNFEGNEDSQFIEWNYIPFKMTTQQPSIGWTYVCVHMRTAENGNPGLTPW